MNRFLRVVLFVVMGTMLGAAGGLVLPSVRTQDTGLGLAGILRLGAFGALVASAGSIVERNLKKLLTAWIIGAATFILLVLGILGLSHVALGLLPSVLAIIVAAALFPAVVAFADCLVDELYRAILYETFFSAIGGMAGLVFAWAWHWTRGSFSPFQMIVPAAIYSAVIWLGMGLAKRIEESEETLEAREESGPS